MLSAPYGEDKINCSGCGACEQICSLNSISMQIDAEGFNYPVINPDTCNSCELCSRICPITNQWHNKWLLTTPDVYAAWHLNDDVRAGSASGGVFSALANKVLSQHGIVFGAAFDKQLQLRHIGIETKAQLAALRGSKYIQSINGNSFQQAKESLKRGQPVLYTGTPCQIAGLYAYLQRDYEHLYTCDIFCHGVPSPKVFRKHLQNLEQKHHAQVINYRFRSKYFGWRPYGIHIEFSDGKVYNTTSMLEPFTRGFLESLYLRPICSVCPYTSTTRTADVSIGDFWGIDKYLPELDDNKGISTVLVNTQKGREIFESCRSELFIQPCGLKQALQGALSNPSIPSSHRPAFFADLDRLPFRKLQRKYILGFKQYTRYYAGHLKNRLLNAFHVIR